ncbi:MAG: hypothetical protein PHR28_10655, partial [candidate division Zixibacteria bacterium]|nr:hypothetical protein [candidate division Zixibacteria bacterium]
NDLYSIALSDLPDEEILKHFLAGKLPKRLAGDFFVFFDAIDGQHGRPVRRGPGFFTMNRG